MFQLRKNTGSVKLHWYKLQTNYPVIQEFEEKLSRPFYFRQKEHGTVVEVLFDKVTESPEAAVFLQQPSS